MIFIIILLIIIILAIYFLRHKNNGYDYSKPSNNSIRSDEEEPYYIYADADRINEELLHDGEECHFDDFDGEFP